MPEFRYKAVTVDGKSVRGTIQGESAETVSETLKQQGVLVTALSRVGSRRGQRPEGAELMLLSRELSALLRAGITLVAAVELASRRASGALLGQSLADIHQLIQAGRSPGDSFERHREVFDPMFISAMRLGERNAALPEALDRYYLYQRRRLALRRKLGQAALYPSVLLFATSGIMAVLMGYSLPRFQQLYADLGTDLPGPTQWVMGLADIAPATALALLASAAGAFWLRRIPAVRFKFDRSLFRWPGLGAFFRSGQMVQIAHSLSLLLKGGTPLVDALHIAADTLTNEYATRRWRRVAERVRTGHGFTASMTGLELVSESDKKIIEAGEQSGQLGEQFSILADYHEELLDLQVNRLTSIMEPLLMFGVGLFVGAVVIALYLPIFGIAGVIG